ncbi:MAG: ParB/RepB/Spo0J family partition protein [Hyphomicrobiales bacterium]|nr:ParB/RepB/Spo0J family partition protein [Hyphomicrobiales bacterium]MDE2114117.1 ParB/RepB/Spo0J family partition protein [Hyphomicrobiales bacterium]
MAEEIRPRLGRGLAALIGDTAAEPVAVENARGARRVPVEFVRPNPRNPRKAFAESDLSDLAESIRNKGIIQPILVRSIPRLADAYEIVAGERRWRAAQMAGLHDVPIVVLEVGDKESLEIAIVENVQRADLNPLEEAQGYAQLGEEFGYTQMDLAKVIGKSRSHIANTMRLLKLSPLALGYVADGSLSAGHARALLSVRDSDSVAKRIVEQGLTVRDVERIAQLEASQAENQGAIEVKSAVKPGKDADTRDLETVLSGILGLTVIIDHRGERGEVKIRYKNLEQLDALCNRLKS